VSDHIHDSAATSPRKRPLYPFHGTLNGHHSRCGLWRRETLPGTEPRLSKPQLITLPPALRVWKRGRTYDACTQNKKAWRTMHELDDPRFESRQEKDIFVFFKTSRQTLGSTQPPVGTGFFQGLKRPGCEVYHSPHCTAEVNNEWIYTSTHLICLHGVHWDYFAFLHVHLILLSNWITE
jgi:hypothetical protein